MATKRICEDGQDHTCFLPERRQEKAFFEQAVTGTGSWRHHGENAYPEDLDFAKAIARFLASEGAENVLDVGSGSGALVRTVAARANISVLGIDGNVNTVQSRGPVTFPGGGRAAFRYVDLSRPFPDDLERFDWAMSIAVAEHVPFYYEHVLLSNFLRASKRGLILMWGARFMSGVGHVNCRDEPEVLSIVKKLGFEVDLDASRRLQRSAKLYWNRYTLVLRRPPPGELEAPSLQKLAEIAREELERACWPEGWGSYKEDCCQVGGLSTDNFGEFNLNYVRPDEEGRHSCFGDGFDPYACCAGMSEYRFPTSLDKQL